MIEAREGREWSMGSAAGSTLGCCMVIRRHSLITQLQAKRKVFDKPFVHAEGEISFRESGGFIDEWSFGYDIMCASHFLDGRAG